MLRPNSINERTLALPIVKGDDSDRDAVGAEFPIEFLVRVSWSDDGVPGGATSKISSMREARALGGGQLATDSA